MSTVSSVTALLDQVVEGVDAWVAHGAADLSFWPTVVPPRARASVDSRLFHVRAPELEVELRIKWHPYPDPRPPSAEASPMLLRDLFPPMGGILLLLYFRQPGTSRELKVRIRRETPNNPDLLGPGLMRGMRREAREPSVGPSWWDGWWEPPLPIEPGQTPLEATRSL